MTVHLMPPGKKKARAKFKRQRARLFEEQKGLCHWCKRPMQLLEKYPDDARLPLDAATLDHLRDRFHPERHQPATNGERRHVLACFECNQQRGQESVKANSRRVA